MSLSDDVNGHRGEDCLVAGRMVRSATYPSDEDGSMIQLKRILFPTDLSDPAAEAQLYASTLAQLFRAELHVLTVVSDLAFLSPEVNAAAVFPTNLEEVCASAEQSLQAIPGEAWSGLSVQRSVRLGTPFVEIVRYARELEIDLVVLGTHGRSGLTHALLGSTAEKVVRKAPCAVLTVKSGGHQFVMP